MCRRLRVEDPAYVRRMSRRSAPTCRDRAACRAGRRPAGSGRRRLPKGRRQAHRRAIRQRSGSRRRGPCLNGRRGRERRVDGCDYLRLSKNGAGAGVALRGRAVPGRRGRVGARIGCRRGMQRCRRRRPTTTRRVSVGRHWVVQFHVVCRRSFSHRVHRPRLRAFLCGGHRSSSPTGVETASSDPAARRSCFSRPRSIASCPVRPWRGGLSRAS